MSKLSDAAFAIRDAAKTMFADTDYRGCVALLEKSVAAGGSLHSSVQAQDIYVASLDRVVPEEWGVMTDVQRRVYQRQRAQKIIDHLDTVKGALNKPKLAMHYAQALKNRRRHDEARDLAESVYHKNPQAFIATPSHVTLLSVLYTDTRQPDKALDLLRYASQSPACTASAAFQFSYGIGLLSNNELRPAMDHFNRLSKKGGLLHRHRGVGRVKRALKGLLQ